MSLSARDRQTLESIESALTGSDPKLASMLKAFTWLASGEDMPGPERIERRWSRAVRGPRAPSAGPPGQHRNGQQHNGQHHGGRYRWRQFRMPLLWLVISLALITAAVFLSRVSPSGCGTRPAAVCLGHSVRQPGHRAAAPAEPLSIAYR